VGLTDLKDLALKGLQKPSPYGPDVDLSKYNIVVDERISTEAQEIDSGSISKRLGFDEGIIKKAEYVQVNESPVTKLMMDKLGKYGAVVLPTKEALSRLDWVKEYAWRLIKPDRDKFVASTYLYGRELGFFIYVPKGVKVVEPIYTCLFITKKNFAQLLHNIVVVDDGAELNLITGCGVPDQPVGSLHVGISEYFVGRNAKLTYAMIHAWSPDMVVRPRTSVYVRSGGQYVSYYMIYSPVESLQTFPEVVLEDRAVANTHSIVVGEGSGYYDVGSSIVLSGVGSSAEIISRNLGKGNSRIYARAKLSGVKGPSRGHIECLGLLADETASIESIPELSSKSPEAILTHEAAIGKISEEQINYLMSKGFSEDEARSLIIRGFLSVEEPKLPKQVRETIKRVVTYITSRARG